MGSSHRAVAACSTAFRRIIRVFVVGCRFCAARVVRDPDELDAARVSLLKADGPLLVQFKVVAEKLPLILPPHDGVVLKQRFQRALLG